MRRIRWSAAAVIAIVSVAVTAASYWYQPLRICREITSGPTVAVWPVACSPWSTADLVPLLVVPLLLIFPELGELTIMNVLSLKRKTEAQQAEIESTKIRQNDLEFRVLTQVSSMNANQNLTQNFYREPSDAAKLPEEVDREEQVSTPASSFTAEDYENRDDPYYKAEEEMRAEMGSMAFDLLQTWDAIDLQINPLRKLLEPVPLLPPEAGIREFAQRHQRSLTTIREVRNSIAHGRMVPYDALNGAVTAARKLEALLNESFGPPPEKPPF